MSDTQPKPSDQPDPSDGEQANGAAPLEAQSRWTRWLLRMNRSRFSAWMEAARPVFGLWLFVVAAVMVVGAARGAMEWSAPIVYASMVQMLAWSVGLLNDVFDVKIDSETRLMRPLPANRLTVKGAAITAVIPFAIGTAIGFGNDWRVAVIGLAMVAASMLYSYAWRGSVLGIACFALIGVLLPAGAVEHTGASLSTAHLLWLVAIGALSGAAAYMIYKLPYYEYDDQDGYRSVLHWLGIETAIAMSWAVLAAALALAAASLNLSGGNLFWILGPLLYLIGAGLFCIWLLMHRINYEFLLLQRWLIVPFIPLVIVCWLAAAAGA